MYTQRSSQQEESGRERNKKGIEAEIRESSHKWPDKREITILRDFIARSIFKRNLYPPISAKIFNKHMFAAIVNHVHSGS